MSNPDKFALGGDRPVKRLGLGAMRLAIGGSIRDPEAAVALLRRAADLGVDHLDTAGFYGAGALRSHELIREALSPYPDELVIATKFGPLFQDGRPAGQAGPDDMRALVEDDLRRLGVERLDLAYLRAGGMEPTPGESIGDRFAALAELREGGLIRHLGVSNVDAAQLEEARSIAPVAAVQNQFHVHYRGDAAILERCEREGIAYAPFFPLGGGMQQIDAHRLAAVAARHDAAPRQIALAWLLAVSPATLAIPGTSSIDHLMANTAAAGLRLTATDMAELNE
ncbi:aldo/keto reductase [Glycomyces sp. A-F 0318]|uniref:aldo/keto reductase n=1 Tax=Glycomyces amatae TaxID=2881355 RepID=UPI001E44BCC7|nr:aldo/keto reductase [Glycomyces amatae]MCD0443973.1 aldo/keto reductase [Glycomyces amatae]